MSAANQLSERSRRGLGMNGVDEVKASELKAIQASTKMVADEERKKNLAEAAARGRGQQEYKTAMNIMLVQAKSTVPKTIQYQWVSSTTYPEDFSPTEQDLITAFREDGYTVTVHEGNKIKVTL